MKYYLIKAIAFKGQFYVEGWEHDLPEELIEALGDSLSEYAIEPKEVGKSVQPVSEKFQRQSIKNKLVNHE